MASLRRWDTVPTRTALACGVGALVTALILTTPYVTFGLESPSAHLVLNSLDACVGLLVAYLLHGRFLRNRRLQDLLLSQGLALLVIAGLGLDQVAQLRPDAAPGTLDVWLPVTVRVTGAVLIVTAALVGPRRCVDMRPWHRWAGVSSLLVVAGLVLLLWVATPVLPVALDLSVVPTSAQHPILTGHPLFLLAQASAAMCMAVAALLFTLAPQASADELFRWLGPACALGAFARLNYVLYPSLYTDWLYTGDLLRTGFYLLLLVGAMREIRQYWADRADLAVLDDRRRLARELHDGVIQELTYIRAQTLQSDAGAQRQVVSACDRALEEARAAVLALGTHGDEPLAAVLERTTRQLAEQHRIGATVEIHGDVEATPEQQHALVRLLREACTNAVRHGAATEIRVTARQDEGARVLCVQDNGTGFDLAEVRGRSASMDGGYGLVSMAERARSLPGSLNIESTPGVGSEVRVTW